MVIKLRTTIVYKRSGVDEYIIIGAILRTHILSRFISFYRFLELTNIINSEINKLMNNLYEILS